MRLVKHRQQRRIPPHPHQGIIDPRQPAISAPIRPHGASQQHPIGRQGGGNGAAGLLILRQQIGARSLRPDHHDARMRVRLMRRPPGLLGQRQVALENRQALILPPFQVLRHIALHQDQPGLLHRRPSIGKAPCAKPHPAGQQHHTQRPPAPAPQRRQTSDKHRQQRQPMHPQPCRRLQRQGRKRPDRTNQIPRKAGEHHAPQHLSHHPGAGEGQHPPPPRRRQPCHQRRKRAEQRERHGNPRRRHRQ